jgi:hypothetical protein
MASWAAAFGLTVAWLTLVADFYLSYRVLYGATDKFEVDQCEVTGLRTGSAAHNNASYEIALSNTKLLMLLFEYDELSLSRRDDALSYMTMAYGLIYLYLVTALLSTSVGEGAGHWRILAIRGISNPFFPVSELVTRFNRWSVLRHYLAELVGFEREYAVGNVVVDPAVEDIDSGSAFARLASGAMREVVCLLVSAGWYTGKLLVFLLASTAGEATLWAADRFSGRERAQVYPGWRGRLRVVVQRSKQGRRVKMGTLLGICSFNAALFLNYVTVVGSFGSLKKSVTRSVEDLRAVLSPETDDYVPGNGEFKGSHWCVTSQIEITITGAQANVINGLMSCVNPVQLDESYSRADSNAISIDLAKISDSPEVVVLENGARVVDAGVLQDGFLEILC